MNWEALGAVGETVGAIAVCITLIFLTVQLRQSNRAQKSTAYQTYLNARTEWLKSLQQPEVKNALMQGSFSPLDCSEDMLQSYQQIMHLSMTYFAGAYRLWKDGLLSDEEWQSNLSLVSEYKGTEGFELWWPAVNNFYNADFVQEIENSTAQSTGLERFLENVEKRRAEI